MRTATVRLVDESCVSCGTPYAVEATLWQKLKDYGGRFYCPNGHSQSYTTPELQKAQQRIKSLEAWSKTQENQIQQEKYQHAATKGKLTKFKNRVAAGVCPCCNRTFQNLQRHMTGQHPNYKDSQ